MSRVIETDPEGLTLPGNERYDWSECEVTIEVKAHIKLPNDKNLTMTGHIEGPDVAHILVRLLNETTGKPEPLQ